MNEWIEPIGGQGHQVWKGLAVRRFAALITLVGYGFFGTAVAGLNEDGDWQLWNQDIIVAPITENVAGTMDTMFRFGDDLGQHWYHHVDVGLVFKVNDWVKVKPSYRHKFVWCAGHSPDSTPPCQCPGTADGWRGIDNPSLNVIVSESLEVVKLSNNCRFSYWDFDDAFQKKDRWFYRNILTVMPTDSYTDLKIKPFVREDFFFDLEEVEINRNRLSAGLAIGDCGPDALKPSVYLMWQASKAADWVDNYIGGVDIKIAL